MIAMRLQGRLGNQLFQYAFIYSASKKIGVGFYLDQYFEKSLVHKYFQIGVASGSPLSSFSTDAEGGKDKLSFHLRRNVAKFLSYFYKLKTKAYEFDSNEADVEFEDKSLYIGYFQSLLFMSPYENPIRRNLVLKKKISDEFDKHYRSLYQQKTVVTIHIRRTDYKVLGHLNLGSDDLSLPLKYYQNAISSLKDANLHYIFISDDIGFVEDNFASVEPKIISKESDIFDFQHLVNADICIISNSTFSWWGAWLNAKKNKIVYCPKYYLGHHLKKQIPQNIYPKEWRQIDFD
jgi:hypothetical protein